MKAEAQSTILKIVTVDDSHLVAERLQAMLSEISFVEFAGNATNFASALTLIDEQNPNVVILDINLKADMPRANGINLLIVLRQKSVDMKIIMLTNLTEPQYRDYCMSLGANYFLDKSNDFERIPEVVHEIMQTI